MLYTCINKRLINTKNLLKANVPHKNKQGLQGYFESEGADPGEGGGSSHTLNMRVCAAEQGMVFKHFCQEQAIENTHLGQEQGVEFKQV